MFKFKFLIKNIIDNLLAVSLNADFYLFNFVFFRNNKCTVLAMYM